MLMSNKDVSSYILQGQHKGADKVIQVLLKRTFLSFAQRFVRLDGLNAEFPFTIQREMPQRCNIAIREGYKHRAKYALFLRGLQRSIEFRIIKQSCSTGVLG